MPTLTVSVAKETVSLLEALDDAALLRGPQGEVCAVNSAAASLLGLKQDGSADLDAKSYDKAVAAVFYMPRGGGSASQLEARGLPRRVFTRRVSLLPGTPLSLEVFRDCTDEVRAEEERRRQDAAHQRDLEQLRARAEHAENFKMELTANVTHDLRTPLASIKASVSGLLAGDVEYDRTTLRETLSVIEEETDRLQRRVANLLSMARMDAGDASQSRDWVDMSDVAACAVESLRALGGDREVRLEIPHELPLIWGDYDQLHIAVRNLLENALLYSPPGDPVEVSVSQGLGAVRVRVRDYGQGLMPDEFERVFDRFYRGRRARRIPGSGLGLPICRGIAEEHGGRLWAEHAPGGGVAFVLSLPVPDQAAPQMTEEDGPSG